MTTREEALSYGLSFPGAYLYAPLAHKLGLYKLKSELEDLSLKYLEHDAYYMIKVKASRPSRSSSVSSGSSARVTVRRQRH